MATLTGKTIASTYKDLLQVSNNNSGIDATLRNISDGEGTTSPLQLSNSTINLTGTVQLQGSTLTANASALNNITDCCQCWNYLWAFYRRYRRTERY